MTNATHTPGPWAIRKNIYGSLDLFGDGGSRIIGSQFLLMNQEANANLIAAAPELLAALEAMHACHRAFSDSENWTVLDDEARLLAEKAIAKAKGANDHD